MTAVQIIILINYLKACASVVVSEILSITCNLALFCLCVMHQHRLCCIFLYMYNGKKV